MYMAASLGGMPWRAEISTISKVISAHVCEHEGNGILVRRNEPANFDNNARPSEGSRGGDVKQ